MIYLIVQDVLLVLVTAGCVFLFFTLKREVQIDARRQQRKLEALAQEFQRKLDVHAAMEKPRQPESGLLPGAPRPGFNLNTRVHALRMLRRGEDVNHIAAALGVPRREVELLIRVQEIVTSRGAIPHQPVP